ncbi:hypothetical protein EYF80_064525 [Liparis tanakae]|uniref:Uncharacterized protein n=1 Tax=Liparis tanakae TaxID=230148 RepID=A0A4Z2E941_9TELE|nr:hypothetical protein EYF80_064525 [Liparis tanakae]
MEGSAVRAKGQRGQVFPRRRFPPSRPDETRPAAALPGGSLTTRPLIQNTTQGGAQSVTLQSRYLHGGLMSCAHNSNSNVNRPIRSLMIGLSLKQREIAAQRAMKLVLYSSGRQPADRLRYDL